MRRATQHLKKADPVLAGVIDRIGPFRMKYREPDFETLVRSIIYQQLSGKAAATIMGRLATHLDGAVQPERVLKLSPTRLKKLGISPQKAGYLKDLARHTINGSLPYAKMDALADEQVIQALTAVKGIGVWTAQMFLMFALRRLDVLPTGDLGVRNAIQRAYGLPAPPKPAEIEAMGEPWRPYRSVASWYLWRSLDGPAEI